MGHTAQNVGFLLIPGFALTSFSLAVEALSVANTLSESPLYTVTLYNDVEQPTTVVSSNQVPAWTENGFSAISGQCSILFVCAFQQAAQYQRKATLQKLAGLSRQQCRLAALSGGSFLLAKAGVLNNLSCTVVSEQRAAFKELYPHIVVQENLFTVNRNILSCAGGMSALDMVLYMIAGDHGYDFAARVSEQFLQDRMRSETEMQQNIRYLRLQMKSAALGAAVEIMEKHIEQPCSISQLAEKVGTSTRTLENVFCRHEGMPPSQFYLKIRLEQAKTLVKTTHLPFIVIAQSTGFSSHSYFAKRFREAYGQSPSTMRLEVLVSH